MPNRPCTILKVHFFFESELVDVVRADLNPTPPPWAGEPCGPRALPGDVRDRPAGILGVLGTASGP
jgi:hypothetical protein